MMWIVLCVLCICAVAVGIDSPIKKKVLLQLLVPHQDQAIIWAQHHSIHRVFFCVFKLISMDKMPGREYTEGKLEYCA